MLLIINFFNVNLLIKKSILDPQHLLKYSNEKSSEIFVENPLKKVILEMCGQKMCNFYACKSPSSQITEYIKETL